MEEIISPPPGVALPSESDDDPRAARLRFLFADVGVKKRRCENLLVRLDAEEERLAILFARIFPGETLRPETPWVALSWAERMTAHFVCVHGGVQKPRVRCAAYVVETGDVVRAETWAVRLSRLVAKGVLLRERGWRIAPAYAEVAAVKPEREAVTPEVALARAAARARRAKEKRVQAAFCRVSE